jgi:hypothetical protein
VFDLSLQRAAGMLLSLGVVAVLACRTPGYAQPAVTETGPGNAAAATTAPAAANAGASSDNLPPPEREAQNPSLINGLQLEGGYLADQQKRGSDRAYYRLEYKGKLLQQKGTPFADSNVNQPVGRPDPSNPGGDTHNLVLKLFQGVATGKGNLFDALGVRSLHLPFSGQLRGAVQLSGLLNGDEYNLAAGLETAPYHPLSLINRHYHAGITNWLIFGFSGESRHGTADLGGNRDVALFTYRSFAGKAFQWSTPGRYRQAASSYAHTILATAPDRAAADALAPSIKPKPVDQRTDVEKAISDLTILPAASTEPWQQTVREYARSIMAGRSQRPTYALWLEDSGWYTAVGPAARHRWNNLVAATATWWIRYDEATASFVRLRYENGRERALPAVGKNFLAITGGIEF